MQQSQKFQGGDDGNDGAMVAQMEDMTRLTDREQMANFLTYGKWNLNDALIEKLIKDDERKERVRSTSSPQSCLRLTMRNWSSCSCHNVMIQLHKFKGENASILAGVGWFFRAIWHQV